MKTYDVLLKFTAFDYDVVDASNPTEAEAIATEALENYLEELDSSFIEHYNITTESVLERKDQ